jgi:hypothetical protein
MFGMVVHDTVPFPQEDTMSKNIRRRRITGALVCAGFLAASGPAQAVDGVREINQTCAVNTGCFSGDAAGFPVAISERGSYVLTSNLEVPDANTTAIDNTGAGVTIDLNGFVVFGPGGSGTGNGIASAANLTTVRNGIVRLMGGTGISLTHRSIVENVTVQSNGSDGVLLGDNSLLLECIVQSNGGAGLAISIGQVGYARNMFQDNANGSVEETGNEIAVELGGNSCDDGLCSSDGRRRFYLTTTTHQGGAAPSACASGFHMASLWEIHDVSGLRYDTSRGATKADSGAGPPNDSGIQSFDPGGWIRTGAVSSSTSTPGLGNCSAYSSNSGTGTFAYLVDNWTLAGEVQSPWGAGVRPCNEPQQVWCIQD